jgi:AAA domain
MSSFAPRHVSDLAAEVAEEIVWLVYRLVPVGILLLLAGYMKIGKSTLAYELAVAIAQGRAFLDRQTLQGGVLILAVEEHRRDVLLRLRHLGMKDTDPVWVQTTPGQDDPDTLGDLEAFVREKGIRFVLVDTLASFVGIRDETDNAELTRHLKPILHICRRTEAVIALIHHERKSGGEGGRGIRGGGAILALVDQAFELQGTGAGNERRLKIVGRYKAETGTELILDYVDERYICRGTPEDRIRQAQAEKVHATLPLEGDGYTVAEVAELVKLSRGATRQTLEDLFRTTPLKATRTGAGKRGSPFRYRRADVADRGAEAAEPQEAEYSW